MAAKTAEKVAEKNAAWPSPEGGFVYESVSPSADESAAASTKEQGQSGLSPHMRNGQVYPDLFPFDPPSAEEAAALELEPRQRVALEHMLLGNQLSVAARAAGVTRMTLYRWLNRDAKFQAAYNTWQADAVLNSRTRILAMTNTATTTLELAVQTKPRIALAVLKAAGVLRQSATGPTELQECEQQIEQRLERAQRRSRAAERKAERTGNAVAPASTATAATAPATMTIASTAPASIGLAPAVAALADAVSSVGASSLAESSVALANVVDPIAAAAIPAGDTGRADRTDPAPPARGRRERKLTREAGERKGEPSGDSAPDEARAVA